MKTMRKLFALVLAMTMVFAMAVTAGAASITINGAAGSTSKYQIIKMFSIEESASGLVYRAENDWIDFVEQKAGNYLTIYKTLDDSGAVASNYVVWKQGVDASEAAAAQIAKLAAAYAASKGITSSIEVAVGDTAYNLEAGYYLLWNEDGTSGVEAIYGVGANADVTVTEKSIGGEEFPKVDKQVQEDSTSQWGVENDADIGQIIEYKTTITAGPDAVNYVLHDKMDSQLTYVADSIKISKDNTVIPATEVVETASGTETKTNYTVVTSGLTDGCTFEVRFDSYFLDKLTMADVITVTYQAALNDNAEAYAKYYNETWLTYESDLETEHHKTATTTFAMKIVKTGKNSAALAGAGFTWTNTTGVTINLVDNGNGNYQVCQSTTCGHTHVTEAFTNNNGEIIVEGLDADTYTMKETTVPSGYIEPATDAQGVINSAATQTVTLELTNTFGEKLPETGGMGTTLFYIIGGLMVVSAAVLLVVKKRMTAE